MSDITINNVTKLSTFNYRVSFSAVFSPDNLSYEISADGINWQTPIAFQTISSPQDIVVQLSDFYIRLSSDYTPPPVFQRKHTSKFNNKFN